MRPYKNSASGLFIRLAETEAIVFGVCDVKDSIQHASYKRSKFSCDTFQGTNVKRTRSNGGHSGYATFLA